MLRQLFVDQNVGKNIDLMDNIFNIVTKKKIVDLGQDIFYVFKWYLIDDKIKFYLLSLE